MDSFSGAFKNNSELRNNFLLQTYMWITCSLIYYMFLQISSKENLYNPLFNTFYSSQITNFGGVVGYFLMKWMGPQRALLTFFMLCTLLSLVSIIIQDYLTKEIIKEAPTIN